MIRRTWTIWEQHRECQTLRRHWLYFAKLWTIFYNKLSNLYITKCTFLTIKTFANTLYILYKWLFNIESKQNREHSTVLNIQLMVKQACCNKAVMFTMHVWNVLRQLQCRLEVSRAIAWLHCRPLADQDSHTPPLRAGAALPRHWSNSCKCGPTESPHRIINWI